ncbi:hypothetical protein CGW93_03950 [candidate division bacterium WOR-3 4484_18]|uniref:Soluble ligand binding domain-containing protein n=1 Tax=candidate division WOR-3 bacterium 4484_18 TaxID=2020626 RepID=A0A257LTK9_UNCW3|nr:MAG: hypothetical protein CGW93_03950 [candidate division bacterium WOR-3 4484_18]
MFVALIFIVNLLNSRVPQYQLRYTEGYKESQLTIAPYVDPYTYMLGPGDVLTLVLKGKVNYIRNLTVNPHGFCVIVLGNLRGELSGLFWVDTIYVKDRVLKAVEDEVRVRVNKIIPGVEVCLFVSTVRTILVHVVGEVYEPGEYKLTPFHRVLDAINIAYPKANASFTEVVIKRKGGDSLVVNLMDYERQGDITQNPFVRDEDIIVVQPCKRWVKVIGEMAASGEESKPLQRLYPEGMVVPIELPSKAEVTKAEATIVELDKRDRLKDVILRVESITPWADLKNVHIIRGEQVLSADVYRLLVYNDTSQNLPLEHGDVIVIPSLPHEVGVEGEVKAPGMFPYIAGATADYYIAAAGGLTERAHTKSIKVKRGTEFIPYNTDLRIEPGDIIYVPRVGFKWWEDYLEVGGTLLSAILSWWLLVQRR